MPIIPWTPLNDLDSFLEDDDWLLPAMPGLNRRKPAMDIYEKGSDIIAEINLPGIDPDKINISVQNQILRISGRTEEEKKEERKGYLRHEIRKGSFERAIQLPDEIKEDEVDATYEKGVLKIIMPKKESEEKKENRIKIKVRES